MAAAQILQGRDLLGAALLAVGAAGSKGASLRRRGKVSCIGEHLTGRLAVGIQLGGGVQQQPGVGWAVWKKISSVSPCSTIRPAYSTATRWEMWRTTLRSWEIKR